MKSIEKYIVEKFKISKDINLYDATAEKIIELCDIDKDNKKTIDFIYKWANENKIELNFLGMCADIDSVEKHNVRRYFSHLKAFDNLPDLSKTLIEYYISPADGGKGEAEEFFTGKYNEPIIYHAKFVLIYHQYLEDEKVNIDKIFFKKDENIK